MKLQVVQKDTFMINKTEQEIMQNWKGDIGAPLVSICTITYNHEKYIAEALDSFLMQETDFPFEIVIDDDCSPDKTEKVIKKYMGKFPNLIKANLRKKNVGATINSMENMQRAKGDYIAYCDGDDSWTDINKLQIQVDFLEANKDYVASGHDAFIIDENGKHLGDSKLPDSQKRNFEAEDLILGKVWILTISWVFRNVIPETFPDEQHKVLNYDTFMVSWLGLYGKSKYHSDIKPACYRVHTGGIWSMLPKKEKDDAHLNTYYWLYRYYDRIAEENYAKHYLSKFHTMALSGMERDFIIDTLPSKFIIKELISRILKKVLRLQRHPE